MPIVLIVVVLVLVITLVLQDKKNNKMRRDFECLMPGDVTEDAAACLWMITNHYYNNCRYEDILRLCRHQPGVPMNMEQVTKAAEAIGFRTLCVKITVKQLLHEAPHPCIVHFPFNGVAVLFDFIGTKVYIADPYQGKLIEESTEFAQRWYCNEDKEGIAILLEYQPKTKT